MDELPYQYSSPKLRCYPHIPHSTAHRIVQVMKLKNEGKKTGITIYGEIEGKYDQILIYSEAEDSLLTINVSKA